MQINTWADKIYHALLSETTRNRTEVVIIWIAIFSFLIHLLMILLASYDVPPLDMESDLLNDPISAIYTPFSFILLFEVYLLVYHIPTSTTNYVGKQYEIITLIVIRRLFKDLSNLELTANWFQDKHDLQLTYDVVTTLVLFLMIYFFHYLNQKDINYGTPFQDLPTKVKQFVRRKRLLATLLVPIVVGLAFYSFFNWFSETFYFIMGSAPPESITNVNNIFFDQFFLVLILTDVLLLLFSFFHTTKFNTFIRNSGFVISTILIRLSFSAEGLLNNILIVVAVLFGLLILLINMQYEKLASTANTSDS